MTREIKFRVWDSQSKSFNYWGFIGETFTGLTQSSRNMLSIREQKELSQQFTGLHDKNGVEIYEGDILKNELGSIEMKWDNELQGWSPKVSQKDTSWEVIGNIYQNPNLLK
jgi:hypothetical protein